MQLDPRLEQDSRLICTLKLCHLRLHKNAAFPWVILIPNLENVTELIDLSTAQQHLLMDEVSDVATQMRRLYKPDKLNIATLGNIVSQLHIHVIARFVEDPAWPGPVWGHSATKTYSTQEADQAIHAFKASLKISS